MRDGRQMQPSCARVMLKYLDWFDFLFLFLKSLLSLYFSSLLPSSDGEVESAGVQSLEFV